MPRLPRVRVPDYPLHIILRGNYRQDIFLCDGDRLRFLSCLRDAAQRYGLPIHAYVLMTNHVHLLVTGKTEESAPRTIQSVGRRYVAYFNARYSRTGTLWEGRYRSTIIDAESYLMACHRYIDLNPVRAGLVRDPEEYLWSSHRFYARGVSDDLLTPHAMITDLAATSAKRQTAYLSMFSRTLEMEFLERIRSCSNKGWVLGPPDFCGLIESEAQRRAAPLQNGWKKGIRRGPRKSPK